MIIYSCQHSSVYQYSIKIIDSYIGTYNEKKKQ